MSGRRLADAVASLCGVSRMGEHAGIFVALAALPLAWGLHWLGGFPLLAEVTVAVGLAVLWAARRARAPVVTDRLFGQLLALWPLSGGLWAAGVAPHVWPWPGWVGGFLLCQGLLLAPPIRRLGVFADDLVSGGIAAVLVLVSAAVAHGWLT